MKFEKDDQDVMLKFLELAIAIFKYLSTQNEDTECAKYLPGVEATQSYFEKRESGPITCDDDIHLSTAFGIAQMLLRYRQTQAQAFQKVTESLNRRANDVNQSLEQVVQLLHRLQNPN
jgi:hypothetical protein